MTGDTLAALAPHAALTTGIVRLEGLARRDQDPNDRRVTLMFPTEAGAAYMQRLAELAEDQAA